MYITSIIWYLSWPAMIAVSTIIIYYAVRKFDNKQNKTVSGPNEVHVNYIRNKDIVNDKVYNIKDDVVTEDNVDDNILKVIKNEINKLDDVNMELDAPDTFQNYSAY